ncbi:hypothetical protein, partial [Bradyrhizobium sp. 17]|uniref:hypothetical protein n=1 Tax=Bradyrhizobium sp. 17 TaxID=2782649 RepID=UPI001FF7CDAC
DRQRGHDDGGRRCRHDEGHMRSRACIGFRQPRVQAHAPRKFKRDEIRSDPEWNPIPMSRTSRYIDRRPSKGITL